MASSIVVLLPHGRRQTVKVNPNTTILEVLENVCQKANLASEEYDLRHHRTILNPSSTIRFSSLPQNAQVELVEAQTKRIESDVKLCLQLESGERIQGQSSPKTSLWEFLETHVADTIKAVKNPVVVYMRREIIGKEALQNTTFRDLGLTNGSGMFRLIDTPEEALRVQANVSTLLTRPLQPAVVIEPKIVEKPAESQPPVNETPTIVPETPSTSTDNRMTVEETKDVAKDEIQAPETEPEQHEDPMEVDEINEAQDQLTLQPTPSVASNLEKVVLLGERNAVVYNMHLVPPAVKEDLPDDFYDLTTNEVKRLAVASSRALREIIDAPLLTSVQRKLDEDGLLLQKLACYKSSVVRVRFPDQTVLQGCFTSIETIGQVRSFVKDFLANNTMDFYLYTTPPKVILRDELRLVEADCVPNAILYFGPTNENTKPEHYLKSDVLDQFSTFGAVLQTAFANKGEKDIRKTEFADSPSTTKPQDIQEPRPSTSKSSPASEKSSKVPKWFKPGK